MWAMPVIFPQAASACRISAFEMRLMLSTMRRSNCARFKYSHYKYKLALRIHNNLPSVAYLLGLQLQILHELEFDKVIMYCYPP